MKEQYFKQPSVMNNQAHFANVPKANIERSTFDRSHGHKTTFDEGFVYPVYLDEILPGDTFTMKSTAFARLATPLKPFMDNLYLDVHYFFVPNRLVWTDWQRFMGETDAPDDDPGDYSIPIMQLDLGRTTVDLASYFGIPYAQKYNGANAGIVEVSALPFRAYRLIHNEWYRDQNFLQKQVVNTGPGPDGAVTHNVLLSRLKRKDYFTGALPWPQKGSPVHLPLGTTAEIYPRTGATGNAFKLSGETSLTDSRNVTMYDNTGSATLGYGLPIKTDTDGVYIAQHNLYTDLSTATAITINDLRTAFQIQRLLERDARGGTRYVEIVLSHFGVVSPDARLQRPEYLGGGTVAINVSPVAQTFSNAEIAAGDLGAVATGLGSAGFQKSFTEHGWVMGLISVRAEQNYQNGVEKMWNRRTRYDHYWPALAHLGEQGIQTREIFAVGEIVADDTIWGYQERYAEYRYKPSRITGLMTSNAAASLDYWHLAVDYGDQVPPLNGYFLAEDPPIERVIAVPSQPHFILDMWFDLKCQRPMPVYSVPGMVDHF